MQPLDPAQILTEAQYAIRQLNIGMRSPSRSIADDCAFRAFDALRRIEEACRTSMLPDVQEWTVDEILAREG